MIPTQKKLTYGSKKALKFRGASLLKIVTVEYSEDAGWTALQVDMVTDDDDDIEVAYDEDDQYL